MQHDQLFVFVYIYSHDFRGLRFVWLQILVPLVKHELTTLLILINTLLVTKLYNFALNHNLIEFWLCNLHIEIIN